MAKRPEQSKKPQKADKRPTSGLVEAENGLNLRVGPHKSFARLGILTNGAEVELLELPGGVKVPGWYLVATPDCAGWVNAEYIRLPEEAE